MAMFSSEEKGVSPDGHKGQDAQEQPLTTQMTTYPEAPYVLESIGSPYLSVVKVRQTLPPKPVKKGLFSNGCLFFCGSLGGCADPYSQGTWEDDQAHQQFERLAKWDVRTFSAFKSDLGTIFSNTNLLFYINHAGRHASSGLEALKLTFEGYVNLVNQYIHELNWLLQSPHSGIPDNLEKVSQLVDKHLDKLRSRFDESSTLFAPIREMALTIKMQFSTAQTARTRGDSEVTLIPYLAVEENRHLNAVAVRERLAPAPSKSKEVASRERTESQPPTLEMVMEPTDIQRAEHEAAASHTMTSQM